MTTTTLPTLTPWRSALRRTPASAASATHGVAWSVHVEDVRALRAARRIVRRAVLDALAAASPVHPSEVVRARAAAVPGIRVSPLLADILDTALAVAQSSDGAYDPVAAPVPHAAAAPFAGCGGNAVAPVRADWRRVALDGDVLRLPAGSALSVLPVAEAVAAGRAAARIVAREGCGAYVVVGDSAAAEGKPRPVSAWGLPLEAGWTVSRAMIAGDPMWSEVTVATPDGWCAGLARAAYAWGPRAPHELAARGASARLVTASGSVVLV